MQERSLDTDDDMVGTIIQDDEVQQDYEPSEREIMSYAIQLGMKPEEDKEFLFIAREGLTAPVPKPWSPCVTKDGRIFYYNLETGDSQWDHPSDQSYKEKFERLKLGQQTEHKSKTLFLNKSEFSMSEIAGSHAGEVNIVNSKNFPESLNFSGITPHNEEVIAKQSISHRSNILSDEFRRGLEVNTQDKRYASHSAEQQQLDSNTVSKKDAWSEGSMTNQEQKENSGEDPLNARIDSDEMRNMKTLNTEEAYENMLGELEVSSISAFQKYENDLKIQLSYVLSEFERNYQDHAAKIEEHYQKELIRSESETENLKDSEVMDFQKEIKSFESKIKGENEEDLKKQIKEVNLQYEAKRKEMEERAEKEIHQCLHEVREKCQSGIQDIGQLNRILLKPHHKRSSSALPQPKAIEAAKAEVNQVWTEKKAGVEIDYQAKCLRLEKELVNKIETSLEDFRKEVHTKLENEGKLYGDNEANIQKKLEVWKIKLKTEYQDKLRTEKEKLEQAYLSSKQELEMTFRQKDISNSTVMALENNLKTEFENKLNNIKLEKALMEQQYQKLREITQQQAKEKLAFVKDCLYTEENELAAKIKLELKSLEKQIADREALLSWLKDDKTAADELEKGISEKEKSIKTIQKETDHLEEEVSQLKSQIKQRTSENQEKQTNKKAEKDSILNQINDLSKRLDRVEVEIGLIRQKPQEASKMKTHARAQSHNMNMGALHSQLGFNKIFRGVQEIRKVLAQKSRRSTSVEKVPVEELDFDISSSTKCNKSVLRGFGGFNARRSSLEPKSDLGDSYIKDYTIERASPIRIKQNIRQTHGSSTKKILPSESKMVSFEWEEEEKAGQKSIVQQRKVSQEYQAKSCQSPSKIQSDWRSLINIEKGLLIKYNQIVQKKKIETRIIQNTLEKEQRDYKSEYIQYKNDPYKTYSKKLKLEILKKSLNAKIQDYNKALSWLRTQEGVMTSKQELLRNLEKNFEKSCKEENFDEDALFYLYKVFKSVQLDLTVSEEFADIRSISFLK